VLYRKAHLPLSTLKYRALAQPNVALHVGLARASGLPQSRDELLRHSMWEGAQVFNGPTQKLLTVTPCLIFVLISIETSVVQYNVKTVVAKCAFHD